MATIDVYNMKREKVGSVELADEVFATEVKEHLFYEVVKAQLASRRQGTAAAKNRSSPRCANCSEPSGPPAICPRRCIKPRRLSR